MLPSQVVLAKLSRRIEKAMVAPAGLAGRMFDAPVVVCGRCPIVVHARG